MNDYLESSASILVTEEYDYDIDLGVVPFINWKSSHGSLKIEIPYDGSVLKKNTTKDETISIGELKLSVKDGTITDQLPVNIRSGLNWNDFVKSNKVSISSATIKVGKLDDPLISIDGAVLDDILYKDSQIVSDQIFGNINAYSNPLALQLSLWVPDLLAETRPTEDFEVETLLLKGENSRVIFMPSVSGTEFEEKLAENLTALANSSGGTILLGADKRGFATNSVETTNESNIKTSLLKAILQTSPYVSIWSYSKIEQKSGKHIIRIELRSSGSIRHIYKQNIYRREGTQNVSESATDESVVLVSPKSPNTERNLQNIFDQEETSTINYKNSDNLIVLNSTGNLKSLRLGSYVSGLINAKRKDARIVVTGLDTARSGVFGALINQNEDVEEVIREEFDQIIPSITSPTIEIRNIGTEKVAIIKLPDWDSPLALYDDVGYIWQNLSLNRLKVGDMFNTYLQLYGNIGRSFGDKEVFLEQATLDRPIRPPERLEKSTIPLEQRERITYDVEYQSQVWEPRPFVFDEDTVGFILNLTAPLQHASLSLGEDEEIKVRSPEAKGQIRIRLDDVLASGFEVTPIGNENNTWFSSIPITKRTYLNLKYTARLNELFQRRRKTSRLRFLIPDVLLDKERLDDLAHICADVGFRVFDSELFTTSQSEPSKGSIQAIRSSEYYDISLLIGLICHQTELKRELHYTGWQDSKSTFTSLLDIRVNLWGMGQNVEKEIGRLQMDLYQTMSRRLHHLRAE